MTMRVGLNILGLPTLRQGGAGLLAGLEARGYADLSGVDLKVLAEEKVVDELGDVPGVTAANEPQNGSMVRAVSELRSPLRLMGDQAPNGLFDDRDVVHYPLSFMVGPPHPGAKVVTAVDLQHVHFPEFFTRQDRMLRTLRWHRSIRRADRVAVYSGFVRDSVAEHLGVNVERIDVVGACCSERFRSADGAEPPDPSGGDFLLYPASPLPNKNHVRLLQAMSLLRSRGDVPRLILVGPLTHDWTPVNDAIRELRLDDTVSILGHVSLNQLNGLYRAATALVFPSLFEGFGNPVLEAMAAGCPVIAADAASVPEVCGDAGYLFNPTSVEGIAGAVEHVVGLPDADRAAMIGRGRDQAEKFAPARMLERLLSSFHAAVDTMAA